MPVSLKQSENISKTFRSCFCSFNCFCFIAHARASEIKPPLSRTATAYRRSASVQTESQQYNVQFVAEKVVRINSHTEFNAGCFTIIGNTTLHNLLQQTNQQYNYYRSNVPILYTRWVKGRLINIKNVTKLFMIFSSSISTNIGKRVLLMRQSR